MSTFKLKTDKKRFAPTIKTVDSTHKKFIEKFTEGYKNIPEMKQKLESYKKDLESINRKNGADLTTSDIEQRSELKHLIDNLETDIHKIESGQKELDYFCMTEDLLMNYYDMVDQYNEPSESVEHNNIITTKVDDEEKLTEHDMSDLDRLNKLKKIEKKRNKLPKKKKRETSCGNIMSYFGTEDANTGQDLELNRATILGDFLKLVDGEYSVENINKNTDNICLKCEVEKLLVPNDGVYVCKVCGEVEEIIMEIDRASMKDQSLDKPGYPYKRINHFNEWLSQFQAKESTDIPESVYNKIIKELKKNRVTDLSSLTLPFMKKLLRNLKLNEYYEHIPHIISKINKLPPPTISREMEEELRKLFREMQEPFEKHKPSDRVNFLSYSYVLHKLCELLEMDDFLKCFPLLKSRSKLRAQDNIWKKICEECHWAFYPSV